ncbi:MAG: hypothetical protein Q8L11_03500, partial [Candidatus Moranbacteria bacterium]|nr:hypothetical protein [Candidatus Moranbacteria bacterium]MDP1884242.1 hypothetical protein [Candidatus Moranbacteria bacterium]
EIVVPAPAALIDKPAKAEKLAASPRDGAVAACAVFELTETSEVTIATIAIEYRLGFCIFLFIII